MKLFFYITHTVGERRRGQLHNNKHSEGLMWNKKSVPSGFWESASLGMVYRS